MRRKLFGHLRFVEPWDIIQIMGRRVLQKIRARTELLSSLDFDSVNTCFITLLPDAFLRSFSSQPKGRDSNPRATHRWHVHKRSPAMASREVSQEILACRPLCPASRCEVDILHRNVYQPSRPDILRKGGGYRDLNILRQGPQANPYFTGAVQPLRMFHDFSKRSKKVLDKSTLEAGVKYDVVKLDEGGDLEYLTLKATQLGLHPRDIDLLSSSTFIPKRATISVQREKVLIRMENVRAIVFKDHVLLFDARRPRMSVERPFFAPTTSVENSSHRARDAFAKALAKQAKDNRPSFLHPMPFHLRVMESLLEETSNFFHKKVDRLKLLVERMLQELTDDFTIGGLQKLLPLRRAVTEVEHDVRDTHEAMDQIIRNDDMLQGLCQVHNHCNSGGQSSSQDSEQSSTEGTSSGIGEAQLYGLRQAAADMLLTYQREVDDAGGALEELRKGIEAAQEVWELGLDSTRNRIIRMNLYISIATASLAVATLPAAFFGMNLVSGLEEHPTMFYWVVVTATLTPVFMLVVIGAVFQIWPKIIDRRRAQDLTGLLDLLRHLDTIDDIVETVASEVAGKSVDSKEFRRILKAHPSAQLMRPKELDIIFRMFDRNRDGVLKDDEQRDMKSFSGSHKMA